MATPFIDSRFPKRDYNTMAAAVAGTQEQRATIAGPPAPTPSFSLQGVEKQAADRLKTQQDQGPMRPMMVNGALRFAAPPAAEAPKSVLPTPGQLAQSGALAAPARPSSPLGGVSPVSPLGGVSPVSPLGGMGGPLSTRGPLRGPVGVGTNNPNAVRVGPLRMPGERELRTAARRGDVGAAATLFQAGQQAGTESRRDALTLWRDNQEAQRRDAEYTRRRADEVADTQEARGLQLWQMQQEQQRRDAERNQGRAWQTEDQKAAWAREDAQRENDSIVGDATIPVKGGTVPAVRTKGGGVRMAGGFIPARPAQPPLPAGLIPQSATRDGIQYGPAQTTTDSKAPAFTYEKEPGTGRITGAVYPVQDPQTGQWRLQRADLNGDGVVSPEEAAAVPAGAAAASTASKTKAGNSYTFK